jgi:S1-C subfamily serine protease
MSQSTDTLKELSRGLTEAVRTGARATVQVSARDGYAASGVLLKPDRVLTASHAVEREENITVVLADGKELAASLAGRDPGSDLALLRLAEAAPEAGVAAAEGYSVGQLVLALARPTDEGIQASLGVVGIAEGSYQTWRGGSIDGVIRTDAAAYPGFAGGPLVDVEGRIVGINTFGYRFGASLTIPVKRAGNIAEKLEKHGTVKRGYLGVRTQVVELPDSVSFESQSTGLLVVGVEKGSAADEGRLLVGDILVAVNESVVANHENLLRLLGDLAGKKAELKLVRAGKIETHSIEIGERSSTDQPWPHEWPRGHPHRRRR